MLEKLWNGLPFCVYTVWPNLPYDTGVYLFFAPWGKRYTVYWKIVPHKPKELRHTEKKEKVNMLNIGDKVIAVGAGRKTKELNGGDLKRPARKTLPGYMGLVVDMVVMTVENIDGDTVETPFYTFHKDDLHLVDTGRASTPLS